MKRFAERFADLSARLSPLCLGLDPSEDLFRAWDLPNDVAGLRTFCGRVLEAAYGTVALIKPQVGYLERFGPQGMVELAHVTTQIRAWTRSD